MKLIVVDEIEEGESVCQLGASNVNGGWAPDVHFQLALTTDGMEADWPGVADPDDLGFWNSICPNPASLLNLKENEKIIGIGETGLDFYYNNSEKEKQISSFKEHIKASIKTNKPLIVHSRDAEKETFDILNEYKNKNLKILMHCFTGSLEFANKLQSLNAYFSASGIITFKNSLDLQNTFKSLPLDKILIETDSPFLAPVPNRGKKNEPSFIDHTAKKLAEIKEIPKEELVKITTSNFNNLFFN